MQPQKGVEVEFPSRSLHVCMRVIKFRHISAHVKAVARFLAQLQLRYSRTFTFDLLTLDYFSSFFSRSR